MLPDLKEANREKHHDSGRLLKHKAFHELSTEVTLNSSGENSG